MKNFQVTGKTIEYLNTLEMTEKLINNLKLKAESTTNISGITVANIGGIITTVCSFSGKILNPLPLGKWSLQAEWIVKEEKIQKNIVNSDLNEHIRELLNADKIIDVQVTYIPQ